MQPVQFMIAARVRSARSEPRVIEARFVDGEMRWHPVVAVTFMAAAALALWGAVIAVGAAVF